jgi:hypothetical protein
MLWDIFAVRCGYDTQGSCVSVQERKRAVRAEYGAKLMRAVESD